MNRNYPCYWSKSRNCKKRLFEDTKDVFIIGSCDQTREEYIKDIKNLVENLELNPVFAEDLKENNNTDAFCDNICSHIRGSRIIINDISAPLKVMCQICDISDFVPSLNVYWEYGYAAGLSKPQIVICEEEQFNKIPFDVAGKQIQKYTKGTLKDILRPLIEDELKKPVPKSRFSVFTSENRKTEISKLVVEKAKHQLLRRIAENDLTLIFTFYPKYNEKDLFLFDKNMLLFLESNLPRRVDQKYPVFRKLYKFTLSPTFISYISDFKWFGNNILVFKDGIITYGMYINGNEALRYGKLKFFPFYEILNCFLAVLDYIKQIFNYVGYNENIILSMRVENIITYRYTVGELEKAMALRDDSIGRFNASGIGTIEKEIEILKLDNPEYKIEISKIFFNPILRGFGVLDSEKYEDFRKLMK